LLIAYIVVLVMHRHTGIKLTRKLVRHFGISTVTICEMFCRLNIIYLALNLLFAKQGRVIYMGDIPYMK